MFDQWISSGKSPSHQASNKLQYLETDRAQIRRYRKT